MSTTVALGQTGDLSQRARSISSSQHRVRLLERRLPRSTHIISSSRRSTRSAAHPLRLPRTPPRAQFSTRYRPATRTRTSTHAHIDMLRSAAHRAIHRPTSPLSLSLSLSQAAGETDTCEQQVCTHTSAHTTQRGTRREHMKSVNATCMSTPQQRAPSSPPRRLAKSPQFCDRARALLT